MPGAFQHFLPANYLANFAQVRAQSRRDSFLWVQRRGVSRPFQRKAGLIAAQENIYTLGKRSPFDSGLVDSIWGTSEGRLELAIEYLAQWDGGAAETCIDARMWAEVLVPFATQIFVRGPDFEVRQRNRMGERAYRHLSQWPDHHNHMRLVEYQRLLGIVSSVEWRVLHFPERYPLVTTDTARLAMRNSRSRSQGYIIPLRKDVALVLRTDATNKGSRLYWYPNAHGQMHWWMGPVVHERVGDDLARDAIRILCHYAINEIYGSSQEQVSLLADCLRDRPPYAVELEPYLLASHREMRLNHLGYYKLLSVIGAPAPASHRDPANVADAEIDWHRVRSVIPYLLTPSGFLSIEEMKPPVSGSLCIDVDPMSLPNEERPDLVVPLLGRRRKRDEVQR